jgi:hypothetical protein
MRRLTVAAVTLALAAACHDASSPTSPPPRATVNVVRQDSTYKPLLSTQGSFYAKVGQDRRVRLVYQGATPTDSGAEFLRFEVPSDGLYRKPDGTPFGPSDSILITVTVVDPKKFLFDFQPAGLQFNPNDPARLKAEYQYANHDYDGDGMITAADSAIQTQLDVWKNDPPSTMWFKQGAVNFESLEELDANVFSFSQFAIAW